jgi:hypothetical protein
MKRLGALALAFVCGAALAQDSSTKSFSGKPKPEANERADKQPYDAITRKPKDEGVERDGRRDILGPAIAKPDNPAEKAATMKSLERLYGADRNITYVKAQSGTGDTAWGVVVDRAGDRITLDTTPCVDQNKRLVTFIKPYKESKIDEERCPTKTYPRSQVIQLGR